MIDYGNEFEYLFDAILNLPRVLKREILCFEAVVSRCRIRRANRPGAMVPVP